MAAKGLVQQDLHWKHSDTKFGYTTVDQNIWSKQGGEPMELLERL